MKASIIIPTYNNADSLEKTLITIVNQTAKKSDFEVLICDDGSNDNTKKIYESFKEKINIRYFFQEDKGFRAGAARNMGIFNAKGEICIFIDTGVLLASQTVKQHIIEHSSDEASVAVIGYTYGFDDYSKFDDILLRTITIDDIDSTIIRLKEENVVDMREPLYQELGDDLSAWPAPWVISWSLNLSVKRSTLIKIGGFDEWYNSWGGEDVDLGLAMFTNGIKFKLSRNCACVEYPNQKLNAYILDPEFAERDFERKRDYMHLKYNLASTKVWYEKRYDELNQELLKRLQNERV
ncbi:MAG: glycosyltransferase [Lachnospiraceae bacterium]|nr:glycosyltransferase [Lachnospiraceae bacterium]